MPTGNFHRDVKTATSGHAVKDAMFGVNYVAGVNSMDANSDFADIIEHLGSTTVRYPGGTVTELYFDPDGDVWKDLFVDGKAQTVASDGKVVEGPGRLFSFAEENDLKIQYVLPTSDLVKTVDGKVKVDNGDIAKVKAHVTDLLEGRFGDVQIDQFEIGNEYYFHADLTPKEYAAVAKAMIHAVSDAIAEFADQNDLGPSWEAPKIAVQSGAGWRVGDNDTIIDGLGAGALSKVDSVIFHYYPKTMEEVGSKDRHLGQIDDWAEATGNPDIGFFMSEWNVYGQGAETGLGQASTLISAFHEMTERGVDAANVWGAQFRWLDAGLSTNFGAATLDATTARLSVAGEAMASMQESLLGLHAFDADVADIVKGRDAQNGTKVVAFGDEDTAVVYIASRSDQTIDLKVKLNKYFGETTHVWAEAISSVDDPWSTWADESNHAAPNAVPVITTYSKSDIEAAEGITLGPYDILRISVEYGTSGVVMADHDPMAPLAMSYDDRLVGSAYDDRITAHIGDDTLYGRNGNDGLRGGTGDDVIYGGKGRDALFGDTGNDTLMGGNNSDQISGGDGDDMIYGGAGRDILSGGLGDDFIYGGAGQDVISAGAGDTIVQGGAGRDYFIVEGQGNVTITDVDLSQGDRISFLGQFETVADLSAQITLENPTDGQPQDLVVLHSNGQTTTVIGMADHVEEFLEMNQDFSEAGEKALALADQLNQMNAAQSAVYFAELTLVSFYQEFAGADPVILFAGLDAGVAAKFLNAIGAENFLGVFDLMGQDGLIATLVDRNSAEIVKFFDVTNKSTAANIVDYVGAQKVRSLLDGMSHHDRGRLEPKLLDEGIQAQQSLRDAQSLIARDNVKTQVGCAKQDRLTGKKHDDTMNGLDGADRLLGGSGNDKLNGGKGGDVLKGEAGADVLVGGAGADFVVAGNGRDFVYGGAGHDNILGGTGSDFATGGAGKDTLRGNLGNDELAGGKDDDVLDGGKGNDDLTGDAGRDVLLGGSGQDALSGGQGRDVLRGGSGNDTLSGGHHHDKAFGGAGRDKLDGGQGRDQLSGGTGADVISGGAAADKLYGNNGSDILSGGAGRDVLFGGQGHDLLEGGAGNDVLTGGHGADVFVFRGEGHDVIKDFDQGVDLLALTTTNYEVRDQNGSTQLVFSDDSSILLQNLGLNDFDESIAVSYL